MKRKVAEGLGSPIMSLIDIAFLLFLAVAAAYEPSHAVPPSPAAPRTTTIPLVDGRKDLQGSGTGALALARVVRQDDGSTRIVGPKGETLSTSQLEARLRSGELVGVLLQGDTQEQEIFRILQKTGATLAVPAARKR